MEISGKMQKEKDLIRSFNNKSKQELHLQSVALVSSMGHSYKHSMRVSLAVLYNHHPESPCAHTLWPQSGMQEQSCQRKILDG
jgi:hypothetical protein